MLKNETLDILTCLSIFYISALQLLSDDDDLQSLPQLSTVEKLSRMDTDEQRRLLTSGERRRRDLQATSRTSLGSISKQAQPSTSGL